MTKPHAQQVETLASRIGRDAARRGLLEAKQADQDRRRRTRALCILAGAVIAACREDDHFSRQVDTRVLRLIPDEKDRAAVTKLLPPVFWIDTP